MCIESKREVEGRNSKDYLNNKDKEDYTSTKIANHVISEDIKGTLNYRGRC